MHMGAELTRRWVGRTSIYDARGAFDVVLFFQCHSIARIHLFEKGCCEARARIPTRLQSGSVNRAIANSDIQSGTMAVLTMLYGASIRARTKSRTLNALRLKPAPGIQVGMFFTADR